MKRRKTIKKLTKKINEDKKKKSPKYEGNFVLEIC